MPKRQIVHHIEHLESTGEAVVTMENSSHHYSVEIPASISLDNGIVGNSRNGSITPLHQALSSMDYATTQVVELSDDHQNGLVPVNSVDFVEISESSLKGPSGSNSLEIYFEDIPVSVCQIPSTVASHMPHTTNSCLPRHEHQTPKAQLLVRAYSEYIQPHEQQKLSSPSQGDDNLETIMPDVLEDNLVHLDQAVLPHSVNEYRKIGKLESLKKFIHNPQQKQMQNFSHCSLEIDDALIEQSGHHQHLVQYSSSQSQQIKEQIPLYQQSITQFPPKYQLQKQYRLIDSGTVKDEGIAQVVVNHYGFQNKNLQEHDDYIAHNSSYTSHVSNTKLISDTNSSLSSNQTLPLVTRSGRPIRRKPEYIEYVNQNCKDELNMQHNARTLNRSSILGVKIENAFPEVEEIIGEIIDDNSNDDDHDPIEVYSSEGRKSLPHKKRIPKKLKNTKKYIKGYKCGECSEEFSIQTQFLQHKLTHNSVAQPELFKCEICTKGFDTQLTFFEHLKSHYEPIQKHKCEVCGGEFMSAEVLTSHSLVHSKVHFRCNICQKTFRRESTLEVHLKVAHLKDELITNAPVEKPYICTVCTQGFNSQLDLDDHVQSDHGDNLIEFNCDDCYRVFKSKTKLSAHQKVEHKEEFSEGKGAKKKKSKAGKRGKEGYLCPVCPRTFAHKNSLIYHVRVHTGERPHQCEQCGKAFYAASALKVHLRLHSGEKPYKCEACGKFFRQWGDLKYHTSSVHSDTRQFQCEFCGKDFKRKYCLVVHRRIHTGEKKYKCEFCQKCFRASSYLQNHKRIHTGERPYPCPDCGKPFRVRSDMKRHRHTHRRDGNGTASNTTSATPSNSTNNSRTARVVPVRQLRQISHNQVQILQGSVTPGQLGSLIITDGVIDDSHQPIRIMVSGIPTHRSVGSQPPPAHKHSQVSAMSLTNVGTPISPDSPNATSNSAPSGENMTTEVIIMDDSNSRPINLNILPRITTSTSSSPVTAISGNDGYDLIPQTSSRSTLEVRDSNDVCVWSGIHVFSEPSE